jgi:3-deoxy-D-manno-octulosonate 8-phosphate phosphatase (KDO 8-P phosphatase)
MDVDGVLTDGRIYYLPGKGGALVETKTFHSRDGAGIRLLHLAGLKTGIITGRESRVVKFRAQELGIHYVYQNAGTKGSAFAKILQASRLSPEQVCFVGDDIVDLPVLRQVGLAVAVANCHPALKRDVHYVTRAAGGAGAVREAVELILEAQNLLGELSEKIASNQSSLVG